jgi:hypothetical protein
VAKKHLRWINFTYSQWTWNRTTHRTVNCPSRKKDYDDDTMSSESLIIRGKTSYRSQNLMENIMAQKARTATANGSGKDFPPQAYDYNDDVSTDTVKEIRAERGVDVSDKKWKLIDSLGQVVPA